MGKEWQDLIKEKSKKLKVILIVILFSMLVGCWDYSEMAELADVTSVAIDKGKEKRYKVTMEGKKFSPAIDIDVEAILYESEGDTVIGALRAVIASSGRKIYIGSIKTIIISEELSKEGIIEILSVFYRDNKARLLVGVYLAKGIEASKLLEDTAMYSFFAGYEIAEVGDQISGNLGYDNEHHVYQIIDRIFDEYKDPILFSLELTPQPGGKKTFIAAGLALFKGDKLIGFITDQMIASYGIWVNRYKESVMSIPYDDKGFIGLNVFNQTTKRSFKFIDGKIHLYLEISSEVGLTENGTSLIRTDLIKKDDIIIKTDEFITKSIYELYNYVKTDIKHDVLEIKEMYRKYHYKHFKEIEDDYDFLNDIEIHIKNNVVVRGSGQIRLK